MAKTPPELEKRRGEITKAISTMAASARKNRAGLIAVGIPTAVFVVRQLESVGTCEEIRTLLTDLVAKTREGPGPWNAVVVITVEIADFIVEQLKLDTTEAGKKL